MSFENAPVSKGLMMGLAFTSLLTGIFDIKHYLHLQLVPHISRYHQYWRLFGHHLAFGSSSDLFVSELLLYNVGVHVERRFGSVKYASFALILTMLATLLEFVSLLMFHRLGLNVIPGGCFALIFGILYQYHRAVPPAYHLRIFGGVFSDKTPFYILAAQLVWGRLPGSALAALIGILCGQVYRSDVTNVKDYRISPAFIVFARRFLRPLLGSTRGPRRTNRALPDHASSAHGDIRFTPSSSGGGDATAASGDDGNDEAITTARNPRRSTFDIGSGENGPSHRRAGSSSDWGISTTPEVGTDNTQSGRPAQAGSVMREWVTELTGRGGRGNNNGSRDGSAGNSTNRAGIRVPPENEIALVGSMFPDLEREVVVAALQRSPNAERAVELLLSSQN